MIRTLGGLLILCGGGIVWYIQNRELRRRQMVLLQLLTVLRRMSEEIRQTRSRLPDILEHCAVFCGEDVRDLFLTCAASLRRGYTAEKTWMDCVEKLPLTREDRAVLAELGHEFHGDEEQICKAISLVASHLSMSAEEFSRQIPQEQKRVSALCFSAAALLVILLI